MTGARVTQRRLSASRRHGSGSVLLFILREDAGGRHPARRRRISGTTARINHTGVAQSSRALLSGRRGVTGDPASARRIKKKAADFSAAFQNIYPGDVLLSHAVAHAVSSAMRGLTAVFGMGTGVTLSL